MGCESKAKKSTAGILLASQLKMVAFLPGSICNSQLRFSMVFKPNQMSTRITNYCAYLPSASTGWLFGSFH